jgi:4-hydroxybenzoate polyprenyltransferase
MNIITFFTKFYRINSWIKNIGVPVLALLVTNIFHLSSFLIVLIASFLVLSHTYSINNYYDYILTKENNFIGRQIHSKKMTNKKSLLLIFLPLLLLLFLIPFMNVLSVIFILLFILLFDLYSCPPLRLKKYPLGLLISPTCLVTFLFFYSYFLVTNNLTQKAILLFTILYSYLTFSSLLHEIAHGNIDKKNKLKSIPNIFGRQRSLTLAKIILIFSTFILIVGLIINFKENYIFIGSIIFNLLRYKKISKPVNNFVLLRSEVFGFEEGLYYLIIISLQNLGMIFG